MIDKIFEYFLWTLLILVGSVVFYVAQKKQIEIDEQIRIEYRQQKVN